MSFIKDNNLMIGGHISFSKTFLPTIKEALNYNMKSLQFFLGNPKSFIRQKLSFEDIDNSYKLSKQFKMNCFSHYPYTSSLCGSVSSLAWNGDILQDEKTQKILIELENELNILSKLSDINGVVIHPGSHKNTYKGLDSIVHSINKINFSKNSKLLLENSAGEGSKLCKNFQELSYILDNIDVNKLKNVGCCIDTAHIWGSGIYDLRKNEEIDRMFYEFHSNIGLSKFNLLHLNDSKVSFNSKKDRHESLGFGEIWKENSESLKYLLKKCSINNIPIILETPNVILDLKNIDLFN